MIDLLEIIDKQPQITEEQLKSPIVMSIDQLYKFGELIVRQTLNSQKPKIMTRRQCADEFFNGSLWKVDTFLKQNPTVYKKDLGKTCTKYIFRDEFLKIFYKKKGRIAA